MTDSDRELDDRLADLADAVYGVARQLPLPTDPGFVRCSPVEINVMRAVNHAPGLSAREVAEAVRLPSSNVSRILRGLEAKDLIEREVDPDDGRVVRLRPTRRAQASTALLRESWSDTLRGTITDPVQVEQIVDALRLAEEALIARRASHGRIIARVDER